MKRPMLPSLTLKSTVDKSTISVSDNIKVPNTVLTFNDPSIYGSGIGRVCDLIYTNNGSLYIGDIVAGTAILNTGIITYPAGAREHIKVKNKATSYNIRTVLNCTKDIGYNSGVYRCESTGNEIIVYRVPVDDTDTEPIEIYFNQTTEIIRASLDEGKSVLVHCQGGVSRSVIISAAYLASIGIENPVQYIQDKRVQADPSVSFMGKI